MSPARRRQMVDREHPSLSLLRQCALLGGTVPASITDPGLPRQRTCQGRRQSGPPGRRESVPPA